MSEITSFLLARIAEDEAVAQIVIRGAVGPHEGRLEVGEPWHCDEQSEHVAVSPARVLAECEAKRAMIHDLDGYCFLHHRGDEPCGTCGRIGCRNLRILASVHADHPHFREEWRL